MGGLPLLLCHTPKSVAHDEVRPSGVTGSGTRFLQLITAALLTMASPERVLIMVDASPPKKPVQPGRVLELARVCTIPRRRSLTPYHGTCHEVYSHCRTELQSRI